MDRTFMEFVKRNLGFLLAMAVSVVILGVLAVYVLEGMTTSGKVKQAVTKQNDFFQAAASGAYTLTQNNKGMAEENRKFTEQELQTFLTLLTSSYGFAAENRDRFECKQAIKDGSVNFLAQLTARPIVVPLDARAFSFDAILNAATPPLQSEVPYIMKQFHVVDELVGIVARAPAISEFTRIRRLDSTLQPMDAGLYTVIPLELSVRGGYNGIVNLVNQIQHSAKGIFLIRALELRSLDQADKNTLPALVLPAVDAAGAASGGARAVGQARPQPPPVSRPGNLLFTGTADKGKMPELTQELRVVFTTPHEIQILMVVDYVEFKKPE